MNRFRAILVVLSVVMASEASGQAQSRRASQPSDNRQTPENRSREVADYYQTRNADDDTALALRRKAEFRSWQRQRRLATLKWFGMSNSRPVASSTPMMGAYRPAWTLNYRRTSVWPTAIVIQEPNRRSRAY